MLGTHRAPSILTPKLKSKFIIFIYNIGLPHKILDEVANVRLPVMMIPFINAGDF